MYHEEEIRRFTEKRRACPGTIGVFWGGSSSGRCPEKFSDVDLFVVTEDTVPREAGMYQSGNITIDYFVNPISRIERQMQEELSVIHDYWAIKIYAFSKITYDSDGQAAALQEKALALFETPFPMPEHKTDMANHYTVYNVFQEFCKQRSMMLQWRTAYYTCLQAILHAVCYRERVPLVPWLKAERLMIDADYRSNYHLKALPSETFCSLFLRCLEDDTDEKLCERLTSLYQWCMDSSGFDPGNYHILK